MHLKRWITGLIGAAILVFLISIDIRWPFYLFLIVASMVGLNEFYNITAKEVSGVLRWSGFVLTLILFLVILMKQVLLLPVVVFLFFALPLIFKMLNYGSSDNRAFAPVENIVIGPVYVCLPIAMLVLIDMQPGGNIWILFLLAVIFANDTGAFYAGKTMGRHRLYRAVSPNKTWEGAVGGLILGLVIACIFLNIDILKVHRLDAGVVVLVVALSIATQTGDLVESMIKRTGGIKDSGAILPGHGGILDRIDGLLFAVPVLYAYMML